MKKKRGLLFGGIAVIGIAALLAVGAANRQEKAERMEKGVGAVLSPTSHALTKKYMYEDYDAFWKNAEENYPFWRVAEETTGNDLEEIKTEYRKKIEEIENDWQFHDLIMECIEAFGGAGHMQPFSRENCCAIMAEIALGYEEPPHVQYIIQRMNSEKSQVFYQYDKEKDTRKLEESMEKIEAGGENFTYTEYKDEKTAVLQIPEFMDVQVNVPRLKECFQKMEQAGIENAVLDIRGNGGGSDDYWINGIVAPNLTKTSGVDYYCLYKGEESKKYAAVCRGIEKVDKSEISNLPKLNREDYESAECVGKNRMEIQGTDSPLFTGRFFVLTDGYNYSSSESFVRFCKETGFATLIGETTGGDGAGYNPLIFSLPNSGICYRFSAFNFINPDGSNNEECGTEPDICANGRDALEVCFGTILRKS